MFASRSILIGAAAIVIAMLSMLTGSDAVYNGKSPLLSGQRSELVPGQPDGFGYSEYPFINLIKLSTEGWFYNDNSVFPEYSPPNELDANGMPLYSTAHSGWQISPGGFTPQQFARPGNYALTWTGAGKVQADEIQGAPLHSSGIATGTSCTGTLTQAGVGGYAVQCDNTACSSFRGYISSTTLTVTTAPAGTGCGLVVGQPVSGAGVTVTKFGTPTIITAKGTGTGGIGTYTVNFSQTIGSSGSPATFYPGGRVEMTVTAETYIGHSAGWEFWLLKTGTARNPTNTVQNLGFYYTCLNFGSCSGMDDEVVYWTGQIGGTKFINTLATMNVGVLRDLGWSNTNFGNQTTWSTRKPTSYFNWDSTYLSSALYAGVTTSTTSTDVAFTGSIKGSVLTVSAVSTGTIAIGQYLSENTGVGKNVIEATRGYLSQCPTCTGTGGTGTYQLVYTLANVFTALTRAATGGGGTYVATATTTIPSGIPVGGTFTVSGMTPAAYNGTWTAITGTTGSTLVWNMGTTVDPGAETRLGSEDTAGPEAMTVTAYDNSVSFLGRPPQDKDTVSVIWGAASPNPSTNLFSADGGTTWNRVLNSGGTIIMDNNVPAYVAPHGVLSTMVFDAEMNKWLQFGSNTGSWVMGVEDYVPPEVFVEICNEVGRAAGKVVSPWFVLPAMTADPLTDWTIQEALYVKNNFPSMVPEFETLNEIWNRITSSSGYAHAKMIQHSQTDVQVLTASAASLTGDMTLKFTTVPSYIQVGTNVIDATNSGAINLNVIVTGINRTTTPQTVTINEGTLSGGVAMGDQIAFSWSAAPLSQTFGGVLNQEEAGRIAALMCQGVSAVYGGDTSKYKCMTGLKTPQEWGIYLQNANARLISSAYVGQNPANFPIQNGCAGANAIQTDCPVPFLQTQAYNYLTYVDVVSYWQVAECGCTSDLRTVQKEISDAYNYFYGNPTTQASIMTGYVGTWSKSICFRHHRKF